MKSKTWYSAKSVFLHADKESGPRQLFEERVIVIRARKLRKAMKLALREATSYARDMPGCEFTGYLNICRLFDKPQHIAEIYSAMHQSDLTADAYLDAHYPPEPSSCEESGREHRFYNRGHGYSACYHCAFVRETRPRRAPKVPPN